MNWRIDRWLPFSPRAIVPEVTLPPREMRYRISRSNTRTLKYCACNVEAIIIHGISGPALQNFALID